MHELIIHNKRLTFEDEGAGEPLVLLHPFAVDAGFWREQLTNLRARHRVVVPNLPGSGGSEPSAPHASPMDKMAEDVAMLLEGIRVQRPVIAGCSMGGYVALQLAQRLGVKLRGLVLSNTRATAETPEGKNARELTARMILEKGMAVVEEKTFPRLLGPHASPAVKAEVLAMIRAHSPEGAAAATRGMGLRADSTAWLASCPVPVLVVHGEHDAIVAHTESESMAKTAPRGTLVKLPRAGHLSPIEDPMAWNLMVGAWMMPLPR
jgi:pimeloyl-ACP methyl ester carboxylesterase